MVIQAFHLGWFLAHHAARGVPMGNRSISLRLRQRLEFMRLNQLVSEC